MRVFVFTLVYSPTTATPIPAPTTTGSNRFFCLLATIWLLLASPLFSNIKGIRFVRRATSLPWSHLHWLSDIADMGYLPSVYKDAQIVVYGLQVS